MENQTKEELIETQNHIIHCLEEQNKNLQRRVFYLEHDNRILIDKIKKIYKES